MNKIKILSPEQAQKISAGEVIERPVNIIKELVENSLDAGATVITISVKNGGKSYIRIVDNGCGMSEEDAVLSFQPHATSKIETIDQLSLIQSYGFRGEALASIAAISSVTLLTKIKDTAPDALGTAVTYAHGSLKQVKAISCLAGTSITIEELFAMIPVRKKFLKADDVEYHALYSLIQAFALSNKLVHFKLIHNEQIVLNLPPSQELNERVRLILPQESAVKTTPLIKSETATQPWCTLSGVIGDPQFWRYNRNYIFLFVNNRWVKNHELSKALLKGYLNVLPEGRFPVAILFLTIAPDYVDINVHPKKEEVRFLKPATIQNIVTQSVTQTLKNNFSSKFGQGIASNETQENKHPVFFETSNNKNLNELAFIQANRKKNLDIFFPIAQTFARPLEEKKEYSQIQNECITEQIHNIDNQESRLPLDTIKHEISINQEQKSNLFNSNEKDNSKISADKKALFQEKIPYKIIGQLWGTYIIIEQGSDCLLIDQHAAHERILYEKMNHIFEKKDGVHLLFPIGMGNDESADHRR